VKKDKSTLICPQTKQFTKIFVCALNCKNKCRKYIDNIDLEIFHNFVEKHPQYEIIGELMAKKTETKTAKIDKDEMQKIYWVTFDDKTYEEVTESEIKNNPEKFLKTKIWDKPPHQYDLIISLKRRK